MKEQLRIMLMTAKILQLCADLFAVFGIALFAYIYFSAYHDNPAAAIADPFFVVIVLIPFMPAAILAWSASKKRKQIKALVEQINKSS